MEVAEIVGRVTVGNRFGEFQDKGDEAEKSNVVDGGTGSERGEDRMLDLEESSGSEDEGAPKKM